MLRLVFVLLLASLAGYAQPPTIEGIGPFKIGKTTPLVIADMAAQRGTQIQTVSETIVPEPQAVYRILGSGHPFGSLCPQTKVYLVGRYEVAGIELKNLYLTFYDELLIDIHCDGSEDLNSALQTKYGPPVVTIQNKDARCVTIVAGREVRPKTEAINRQWRNGSIIASEATDRGYDTNCNVRYLHYLSIYEDPKLEAAYQCDKEWRAKLTEQNQRQAKDKLKDF